MLQLILVRHGETNSNKQGVYCGWTDVELNEYGISQAEGARDRLKHINFDLVVASPLKRTKKTAQIISENIIYDEGLKEINFGLWDNLSLEEIEEKYPDEYNIWMENGTEEFMFPEGESIKDVQKRSASVIDKIIKEQKKGNVLIVTHGGLIRNIISYLLGMGGIGAWRFRINNCGITKIEITEGYAVLTELNG